MTEDYLEDRIKEVIDNMIAEGNLIKGKFGKEPMYLFQIVDRELIPVESFVGKKIEGERIILSPKMLKEMVSQYNYHCTAERVVNTWLRQEVDHNTPPPADFDYFSWERQSREYYRKDLVTLNLVDEKVKFSVDPIKKYYAGWTFDTDTPAPSFFNKLPPIR